MQSNRNDDLVASMSNNNRSQWRRRAFRIRNRIHAHAVLISTKQLTDFDHDIQTFNASILLLIAVIGFIAFPLMYYYPTAPQSDNVDRRIEITPEEYSELVKRIISRLSKIHFAE